MCRTQQKGDGMQRVHIKGQLLIGVGRETHRNECVHACVYIVYVFTHQMALSDSTSDGHAGV